MKIRQALLIIISVILLLTNIATVILYRHKISEMRASSSFETISKEDSTFKACLDRNGIENKIEDGHIKIREVDNRSAIGSCA